VLVNAKAFPGTAGAPAAAGANDAWYLPPAELLRHGFFRDAVIALPVV
jgi:hypothetical protein